MRFEIEKEFKNKELVFLKVSIFNHKLNDFIVFEKFDYETIKLLTNYSKLELKSTLIFQSNINNFNLKIVFKKIKEILKNENINYLCFIGNNYNSLLNIGFKKIYKNIYVLDLVTCKNIV